MLRTALAILIASALLGCSDSDPTGGGAKVVEPDGGDGDQPRTATDLHGAWLLDGERMLDKAAFSDTPEILQQQIKAMESMRVDFEEGVMKTSQGKSNEWKIASMDGDAWKLEMKRDSKDEWESHTLEWIDDDHVKVAEDDGDEVVYLKRKR